MNILYKIINHIKSWNLIQVNLVLVNVLLLAMLAQAENLDHFVKVVGQLSLSLFTILHAVSHVGSDATIDGGDIGA